MSGVVRGVGDGDGVFWVLVWPLIDDVTDVA